MHGLTFLLDGIVKDASVLMNEHLIKEMLFRCVEKIGMTALPHTYIVEHFPTISGKGGYGISAGLLLVESHIYIHTWPEKKYFRLEISSCKEFDSKIAINIIDIFLNCKEVKYQSIRWGVMSAAET